MLWSQALQPISNVAAREREMVRLADLGDAQDLLLSTFQDPYGPIRLHAAKLLSRQMSRELSDRLARIVLEGDATLELAQSADVRSAACIALAAESITDSARDALVAVVNDESGAVRYHTVVALHRGAANWEGLPSLVERVIRSESDPGVLVVCAQMAAEFQWNQLSPLVVDVYRRMRGTDRLQLALALDKLSVPDLALRSMIQQDLLEGLEAAQTVAAAIRGLSSGGFREAVPHIHKVMKKWRTHPINRVEAAAAIYSLGDPRGEAYLRKCLHSKRKDVRGYAIDLVGELKLQDLRMELEKIAAADDIHAYQAVESLAALGESASLLQSIARSHPILEVEKLAQNILGQPDGDL